MDFGAVLQTNPPASRTVYLAKLAEQYGFSHVWTFDSHLLWQEPYVIYSQILAETKRIMVGPMVTNPATRDWTVTASTYATLNEMYGNRTICGIGRGDSAVRVTNGKPTTLAELRARIHATLDMLKSLDAKAMEGGEIREIVIPAGSNKLKLPGADYLLHFALPNFYFHLTTAYDILRGSGVEIGKRNFMGAVPNLVRA